MDIQIRGRVVYRMIAYALVLLMLWLGGVVHAGTVTYVYTDAQGTPLAEADASGNITATFDYAPYGSQALGTPPSGPGYTGHVNDPESGLVYMQARYYDPNVGRFLSVDPVGPGEGNVFNFNRFGYADNNPVVNMDPDGRCTGSHFCGDSVGVAGIGSVTFVNSGQSGGGSISHSVPKNTPVSMRHYFEKSGPEDMRKAAVGVMDYFGIDHTGVDCCDIATGGNVRAEMWPDGRLDIGEKLFSNSFGMIAATLYHEVGVHWNLQLSKPDVVLGDNQAWLMREVQAYDLEIKNSSRFNLSPDEVKSLKESRAYYLNGLNSWNRSSVESGIYKP
ncbi:MAG: RHS repeat-associated core domain-containing protein [Rhodanobacter sp.]